MSESQESIKARIIVLSRFRDLVRKVSFTQVFGGQVQKRDDLYLAIIEALEDLEDELEAVQEDFEDEELEDEAEEEEAEKKHL